jgi:transcriptional regulator with XRE-family HTH domain
VRLPALLRILAENVRTSRLEAKRSQEDIAYRAGLTIRTYAALERGQTPNPSLGTVNAVAETLDLEVTDLLTAHTGSSKPPPLRRGRRPTRARSRTGR